MNKSLTVKSNLLAQNSGVNEHPIIELVNLVKQFDDKIVLKDLNMAINEGEFITLLGPSGSGKTTALRLIAGFEWPTRGEIKINGRDVKDLPAYKRPTKTIFQDYALFPHLNVEDNIKYGLKLYRIEKDFIDAHHRKRLIQLQKKWSKEAKEKFVKLDREQTSYEKIMLKNKPKSRSYQKAQKWLDNSDFQYSYWENYVHLKTKQFSDRYLSRKLTPQEMKTEVKNIIELIGLQGNERKSIDQLSGGMKQRVALARSLVVKPKVLLLDEPLSALDLKVRQRMQRELKDIQQKLGMTFILVTHDQQEALTLSDRVAVMRDGKIEQFDKGQNIYDNPINAWVANFIGESNIFLGKVTGTNRVEFLKTSFKALTTGFAKNLDVDIMLRPEDITLSSTKKGKLTGLIKRAIYQGSMWEYLITVGKHKDLRVQNTKKYARGTEVALDWDWEDVHVMVKDDK